MFKQSESIAKLAAALLKAQSELGAVTENATNPFLKSKYADLGEHINTIKPVFEKNGLVITQFPTGGSGEIGVTTILIHESGEWLQSSAVIPIEKEAGNSKAQTAGKAISYLRRYSLAAVANVYSGDDNDGNIGMKDRQRKTKPPKRSPQGQTTKAPQGQKAKKDQDQTMTKQDYFNIAYGTYKVDPELALSCEKEGNGDYNKALDVLLTQIPQGV